MSTKPNMSTQAPYPGGNWQKMPVLPLPKPAPKPSKQRFQITFEASGKCEPPEAVRRLRALLKASLRSYGLRCVDCRPASKPEDGA